MTSGVFSLVPRIGWRAVLSPYVKALLIVAAGTLIRLWLDPDRGRSSFTITFVAVLLAAWAGGLPATLLTQTAVLLFEMSYFGRPSGAAPQSWTRMLTGLGVYYFIGILVALLGEFMRAAQRRAAA